MTPARQRGCHDPPAEEGVWICDAPTSTEISGSCDKNISSTVEGRGLLMAQATGWLSSWSVRSVQ